MSPTECPLPLATPLLHPDRRAWPQHGPHQRRGMAPQERVRGSAHGCLHGCRPFPRSTQRPGVPCPGLPPPSLQHPDRLPGAQGTRPGSEAKGNSCSWNGFPSRTLQGPGSDDKPFISSAIPPFLREGTKYRSSPSAVCPAQPPVTWGAKASLHSRGTAPEQNLPGGLPTFRSPPPQGAAPWYGELEGTFYSQAILMCSQDREAHCGRTQ